MAPKASQQGKQQHNGEDGVGEEAHGAGRAFPGDFTRMRMIVNDLITKEVTGLLWTGEAEPAAKASGAVLGIPAAAGHIVAEAASASSVWHG